VVCPTDQWGVRGATPTACDDLCRFTPYDFAQKQAVNGLMTVVGGIRWSDPCGKASFHSYAGRSAQVGHALVKWINEGVITAVIKGADD
jgi:hypothetical protein